MFLTILFVFVSFLVGFLLGVITLALVALGSQKKVGNE